MSRYNSSKILNNSSEYYNFLRKKRDEIKRIKHFETPKLYHPGVGERTALATDTYIWRYGDRFYQLAYRYYGDVRYWWVIAWFNGTPTEVDIFPGDQIEIPINLENALKMLGY